MYEYQSQIDGKVYRFDTKTERDDFVVRLSFSICYTKAKMFQYGLSFLIMNDNGDFEIRHQPTGFSFLWKDHIFGPDAVCMVNEKKQIIDACISAQLLATIDHKSGSIWINSKWKSN